jgi:hypothetical protein
MENALKKRPARRGPHLITLNGFKTMLPNIFDSLESYSILYNRWIEDHRPTINLTTLKRLFTSSILHYRFSSIRTAGTIPARWKSRARIFTLFIRTPRALRGKFRRRGISSSKTCSFDPSELAYSMWLLKYGPK